MKPICHIGNAFKKARVMLRFNIMKFLQPVEFVKFALVCRAFYELIDENGINERKGIIKKGYLNQLRHVMSNGLFEDDDKNQDE